MSRFCGTCGARLDALALSGGRCLVCGTPIADPRDVIAEAETLPGVQPASLPPAPARQSPAAWPKPRDRVARETPGWLGSARAIGLFLLFALLVAALLAVLVQHVGFQLILAPSASSSSNSSSNSSASSQPISGAEATATAARGGALTPTTRPGSGTPTPAISPTPGASPTATPVPATLTVTQPKPLLACVNAQTQFTIANTGGVSFSWIATANGTGYKLTPDGGTLDGGKQQIVTVSQIGATGKVTVTAQSARNSPQQVTIQCVL
jgi:cytoskeletal protein RodZ